MHFNLRIGYEKAFLENYNFYQVHPMMSNLKAKNKFLLLSFRSSLDKIYSTFSKLYCKIRND